MTLILPRDTAALTATEPEHCLNCFRLIRPGETYFLGKSGTVLCPNCVSDLLIGEGFEGIQATDQAAVDYGGGLIRGRREGAATIIEPGEVRHLVDALVEDATRVVDEQVEGKELRLGHGARHPLAAVTQGPTLTCLRREPNLGASVKDELATQVCRLGRY